MSQETIERIAEDAKALTPQEQQRLIALLDQNLARPQAEMLAQQQRLLEHLLRAGIIGNIPSALYQEEARDFHAPAEVTGRAVSEVLLEDRD